MIWWFSDARRAEAEFGEIEALAKEVDWVSTDAVPTILDDELCCEFDIVWAGESYPLRLHYPAYFPDVPARIKHRDGKQISLHQYGKHGELCLRHRAENWTSDVTGRSMIEDAYALISGEHPKDGSSGHVPSGEALTLGQKHKKAWLRFVEPYGLELFKEADPDGTAKSLQLVHSGFGDSFNVRVKAIEKDRDGNWQSITPPLPGDIKNDALALKIGETTIDANNSGEDILSQLSAQYPDTDLSALKNKDQPAYLLVESSDLKTLCPSSYKMRQI